MIKVFWRFLSDACWMIGIEHLALRFLLMSLKPADNVVAAAGASPSSSSKGPFEPTIVYEDRELLSELGERDASVTKLPQHVNDIN